MQFTLKQLIWLVTISAIVCFGIYVMIETRKSNEARRRARLIERYTELQRIHVETLDSNFRDSKFFIVEAIAPTPDNGLPLSVKTTSKTLYQLVAEIELTDGEN